MSSARASFEHFGKVVAGRVEAALSASLTEFYPNLDAQAGRPPQPELAQVLASLRSLTMRGGKRWRAALVALAYQAFAGEHRFEEVVPAAVALELLQSYLLIHDDWMDQDDTRRGGPSVHAELRVHFASNSALLIGGVALGDAAAILAGDYACALAQSTLLQVRVDAVRLLAGLRVFTEMQRDVVLGQTLDVLAPLPLEGAREHVRLVHIWKTGSYTVEGPLCLGAALAGANAESVAALKAFAVPLGIAFQIRDDLLGTFGDPQKTGKPRGGDLREGKRTAIVAELEGQPEAALFYQKLRQGEGLSESETAACLDLMQNLEIPAKVEQRADAEVVEALKRLELLSLPAATTHLLRGAVECLCQRDA